MKEVVSADRRKCLSAILTASALALAGCTEETNDDSESANDEVDDDSDDEGEPRSDRIQDGPIEILEHEAYVTDGRQVAVKGMIENVGDTEHPLVTITVTFFDGDVQLGSGTDAVDNFGPGRKYEFDAVAFGVDPERVETYQISTAP